MNSRRKKIRHGLLGVVYFFPFQLLLAHFKRNHLLLFFWVLLFGLATQTIANKYGIPQLLLFPEYLSNVGLLSHIILGFAIGSFIMAFNMSSYIMNGFRFQFIATLSRPFLKYSVNNFIIPTAFLVIYIAELIVYQIRNELLPWNEVLVNVGGILFGIAVFLVLSMTYFVSTNKSIFKFLKLRKSQEIKLKPIQDLLEPDLKWYHFLKRKSEWKIETYLTEGLHIRRARTSEHYRKETLKQVFQQNHLNASLFELVAIVSVFFLGWFMEFPIFEIPAGASIFLLLSMFLMFSGALHNWLKGWSILGFVFIFLVANELSKLPELRFKSHAYGLKYSSLVEYSNKSLNDLNTNKELIQQSFIEERKRLEKIKFKNNGSRTLVLVNTSGGGLRSALWTFLVLQQADSVTNGALLDHSAVITGASGGMIGSAYYRELSLRQRVLEGSRIIPDSMANKVVQDVLNPLAFSWVVNDFTVRFRKFSYANQVYTKDRGYYFEKKFNENTEHALNVPISYYDLPVNQGLIPDMWLTPTIVNDGRKLIISSVNTQFLNRSLKGLNTRNTMINMRQLFAQNNSDSLRFSTALRMNATFPYVLPNVTLPTRPEVDVMDAGVRDNYGALYSYLYINSLSNYLDSAFDKIIILKICDNPDKVKIQQNTLESLMSSVSSPVGSVYQNLFNTQRLAQEDYFSLLPSSIKKKIQHVQFSLPLENPNEIPLSWHLSASSKQKIKQATQSQRNVAKMQHLKSILQKP